MQQIYIFIFSLFLLLQISLNTFGQVIYVKADASGTANGSSWDNAYTSLQSALSVANASNEIWVAEGIYYTTTNSNRNTRFTIPSVKDGLRIYGGFTGDETDISQRDYQTNLTILSGNINNQSSNTDNSKILIYTQSGITRNTVIDGFVLQEIYGTSWQEGSAIHNRGSPTIQNCTFRNNRGENGACILNYTQSFPYIKNCIFENNHGESDAGGIYNLLNFNSSFDPETNDEVGFVIDGCTFRGNTSNGTTTGSGVYGGSAIFNDNASGYIKNTTFELNTTQGSISHGGAIFNLTHRLYSMSGANKRKFDIKVADCNFYNNAAMTSGGAIQNTKLHNDNFGRLTITNSTFKGNSPDNISNEGTGVIVLPESVPANNLTVNADNSICYGTKSNISIENSEAGITYQLYDKNTQNPLGTAQVGNGSTLNLETESLNNDIEIMVLAENTTSEVKVALNETEAINVYSEIVENLSVSDADNIICPDDNVVFTASGGVTYVFKIDGVIVQNSSSNTFTTNSLSDNQAVSVEVFNAGGCSEETQAISFQVIDNQSATVNLISSRSLVCEGSEVSLVAEAENVGSNPNYRWLVNGQVITTTQENIFTTPLDTNSVIEVFVIPALSCANEIKAATFIQVQNIPEVSLNISSDASEAINEYQEVSFTADLSNPYVPLTYQWYINNIAIEGEEERELNTSELKNKDEVKLEVFYRTPCGDTTSIFSNIVVFDVITTFLTEPIVGEVMVFPNPSNGVFNVQAERAAMDGVEVYIFDKDGRLVYEKSNLASSGLYSIDISFLSSGIYQMLLISGEGRFAHKIIKQ